MTVPAPQRVAIVTGANAAIERATATELARRGYEVILACRSAERSEPVVDTIRRETANDRVELLDKPGPFLRIDDVDAFFDR